MIFGPTIARRLTRYFTQSEPTPQPFPELTEQEREILSLITGGYTKIAIADRLYLSPKTVRNYVSAIFTKLGVPDRAGAILCAWEAGLGRDTEE